MIAHRVTFEIGEAEVGQSPPSVFERGTMSLGREQLVLDAPDAGTILDESIKRLRWCRAASCDFWFWRADEQP